MYANIIKNSISAKDDFIRMNNIFRDFGSKFASIYNYLKLKKVLIFFRSIPNEKDARSVMKSLIFISNAAGRMESFDAILKSEKNIRSILKIPDLN